ncbi:MAG TPA: glycosyltransferase family 4 protein [Vicinamibacterales bacterium]
MTSVQDRAEAVWIMPDKMGGVATIAANVLAHRAPREMSARVVLTRNMLEPAIRCTLPFHADRYAVFEYSLPLENLHAVLRRLDRAIGTAPGVVVCNDALELLLASARDLHRTVVHIVHGDFDYYYDLAVSHEPYVHAYVAYSRIVYETLCARLPKRLDSIFFLPYGVPLSRDVTDVQEGPLRLLFLGRLDEAKGVLELPEIDRSLRERRIDVTWTIVGDGPAREDLKSAWPNANAVTWIHSATPADALTICPRHDVFVLPSRGEGLPVAMIEAMGAGVVPVARYLPSLVEVVENGVTGYLPSDSAGIVSAIESLATNRDRLRSMAAAARRLVEEQYDINRRARDYEALLGRWRELYRPRPSAPPPSYGSRLDQPWIPNALVRLVRATVRARR